LYARGKMLRSELRAPLSFGLVLASVLSVHAARAQTQAENAATAEALFREARSLMHDGNFKDACPKFEASQRLDPALGTLLNLAECHDKAGLSASAWAEFLEAAAQAHRDGQTERERVARERAAKLESRLTKMVVTMTGTERIEGLVIERDGRPLDSATWGLATPVDPGSHRITVRAPGKKTWETSVDANEAGRTFTVEVPALEDAPAEAPSPAPEPVVAPEPAPTAAPSAPAPSPAPTPSGDTMGDRQSTGSQRTLGIIAGGVGLAGLAVGTALGLSAQSNWDEANCPNNVCVTRDDQTLAESAKSRADWATVAFSAGGALVVTGVVLFLTAPSEPATSASAPRGIALSPVIAPERSNDRTGVWRGVSIRGAF
jgi:hypothetical protein